MLIFQLLMLKKEFGILRLFKHLKLKVEQSNSECSGIFFWTTNEYGT